MKRLAVLFVLVVLLSLTASAQRPKTVLRRVALLVGVNKYPKRGFDDLRWAENDADALAVELQTLGFDKVVVMKGSSAGDLKATRAGIEAQLLHVLEGIGKDDIVLVALSGHGQQLKVKKPDGTTIDDGFFCPADAIVNHPETMVSISDLTDRVLLERGGKNLILLDACRDGVVDKEKGVRRRGIQGRVVSLPEDTAILFSCRAGQKSAERDDLEHGLFTYGVLEALRESAKTGGVLRWGTLVDRVQDKVAGLNADQEPIAAGSTGRLVLGTRAIVAADIPARQPEMAKTRTPDIPARTPSAERTIASEGTRPGQERDDNCLKMKFCWCRRGTFDMGSPPNDPDRRHNEGPVEVTLSRGFWIGKYEVRQDQWTTIMGTTILQQNDKSGLPVKVLGLRGEGPDYPMYHVNHTEAEEFALKLTTLEHDAGRLPLDWEYRLPTEAQWEYACRAGTTTATAFGDSLGSADANCYGNSPYNGAAKGASLYKACLVGGYRGNAWGIHDMHGNVWEWCRDWYAENLAGGVDPQGPSGGSYRVNRGGGWDSAAEHCRAAFRYGSTPEYRSDNLGFRVARVHSDR